MYAVAVAGQALAREWGTIQCYSDLLGFVLVRLFGCARVSSSMSAIFGFERVPSVLFGFVRACSTVFGFVWTCQYVARKKNFKHPSLVPPESN